jgi:mono/diheme cytochrome c family protein
MRRVLPVLLITVFAVASASADRRQTPSRAAAPTAPVASHSATPLSPDAQQALVGKYCATCHSDRAKAGGLSLAAFDAGKHAENGELSEKMIKKLRAGMMPPAGAARPDPAAIGAMVAALETSMDTAAAAAPRPGWRPFQRLNRAEYAAAVRDLVGLDVDVSAYLPADTISAGFDNVADVQNFSPQLMQGYLRAASQISRLAIGDRQASATSATFKIEHSRSQMVHAAGTPIGTRGGVSVQHVFPADGDYVIKASMVYAALGGLFGRTPLLAMGFKEQVDVSVDGQRIALLDVSPAMTETDFGQNKGQNGMELRTEPIHIAAGPHRISAAFLQRLDGPVDDLLAPIENTAEGGDGYGTTTLPHMRDMTIVGPMTVTGVSDTVSRRRVFTCRPTTVLEEEPCAARIIKDLTARAYRGKGTAQGTADAMRFYLEGRRTGNFEEGIRLALQSILVSPLFVFRLERAPASAAPDTPYRVADEDLASRLSFFLWGSGPDAPLVAAAQAGQLRTPAQIDAQVRRMLADRRSEALATRFASQWLRLQDLDALRPEFTEYPLFDESLRDAMRRETQLFFDSIVREDRSVLDLLRADYSFVNERLARHYGIAGVNGPAFTRVTLPAYRRGLLGQASILTLTSVANRTSPVLRGKWVMEVLLGTPPPPPPPDVPALDESVTASAAGKFMTTRQRMEEHRKSPACTSCHRVIDPLGLALDNFDVTGAWRTKENQVAVDSEGVLYDGTNMKGPAGLQAALLAHSDMVLRSFTENLMTYALGRRLEYTDMPAVRAVVNGAARADHRLSAYILGVVNSQAFRMSTSEASRAVTTTAAQQ